MFRALVTAFALIAAAPLVAGELALALPVDCTLGDTCFIQNYVDDDPGPGAEDFTCGPLTYDGHKGTDISLLSFDAMAAGVAVRAAAPGVVRAIRNTMPDTGRDGTAPELLNGKECGNGVVIDHGDGWQTQYCHMKRGSIAVAPGQKVTTGARLGLVGYSGRTQFPHLHISVRHDGKVVDPFAPGADRAAGPDCALAPGTADELWVPPIAYVPGGIIAVGLAGSVPQYSDVRSGAASREHLATDAPALVGWGYIFGGRRGDRVEITLTAPDGTAYFRQTVTLEKTQAQLFRAGGKKAPRGGWQEGGWRVQVRLLRDGAELDSATRVVPVGG